MNDKIKKESNMDKYIVHFRNAGFQIVEADSRQDAINQIELVEDIEGCWEYGEDIFDAHQKLQDERRQR